jgi:hypothetical protein
VVQVHLGPRVCGMLLRMLPKEGNEVMKKLLIVAVVAAGAYLIYRQVQASRAEEDLWTEATSAPDLGASFDDSQPEETDES